MLEPSLLELDRVTKRFGQSTAVSEVSLDILPGEFLALLGPSGCGKTTLLRMIAGLEIPSEGCIRFEGRNMTLAPPNLRPTNMVFQNYALFPHMSVAENVAYGPRIRRVSREVIADRTAEMLQLVRLEGFEERRMNQLSGGQAQRVALARALINNPKLLLLDEPLGALDLKLRKRMQIELRSLQQRLGIAFVYVTHDQEEALAMSDRIALMNQGRIVQVGTPFEMYNRPASVFASDFLGESNLWEGVLVEAVEEGGLHLRVGTLKVVAPPSGDVPAGARVSLSLRPEQITLTAPGNRTDFSDNCFQGNVVTVTFLGSIIRYRVEIASTTPITVQETNPDSSEPKFRVGSPVLAHWKYNAGVVIA